MFGAVWVVGAVFIGGEAHELCADTIPPEYNAWETDGSRFPPTLTCTFTRNGQMLVVDHPVLAWLVTLWFFVYPVVALAVAVAVGMRVARARQSGR